MSKKLEPSSKGLLLFFYLLIAFSVFHFFRDIQQTLHINSITTSVLSMEKNWCGSYCNWITFPFELFIFVGSLIVVIRKRVGILGVAIITVFLIWAAMFLYDYFVFN